MYMSEIAVAELSLFMFFLKNRHLILKNVFGNANNESSLNSR